VLVYTLVTLYTFLALAIICDEYFCESLEAISEALSLSEDVAGATFMAAGSSAPELFTAIVTTLITGGSAGLGTIVGSAVFNIMVIVGVTALCAGQKLKIYWYRTCSLLHHTHSLTHSLAVCRYSHMNHTL
jgi:Ca2+/Na+ antiporter